MSTKRQAQMKAMMDGKEFIDTTLPDKKKSKSTKGHYVKNADLRAELIRCKERGELSNEAAEMCRQIATKLSAALVYSNPDDRDDCISYALMDCVRYWKNYDASVSPNAFAFITTMCKNGFAKGWRALGKIKCPDAITVPLGDTLYSL